MANTTLEEFLLKLRNNYCKLKEREAKYAHAAPLDLLNQIEDYEYAIALTEDAIEQNKSISLEALQNEFDKLNLKILDTVVFVSKELPPKPFTGECPYRGLRKFTEADAKYFFGRNEAVQSLLHIFQQLIENNKSENDSHRLIPVLGASGSGKSSLVRAGLIPALRAGHVLNSDQLSIKVMEPGPYPLDTLAQLFINDINRSLIEIRDELDKSEKALHYLIQESLANLPNDTFFVLVIDQFEEIFVLCEDDRERQQFLNQILFASQRLMGQAVVVLTMRADFYGKVSDYPDLATVITNNQMLVSPMTPKELRQAILLPAEAVGLELEKDLVQALIYETANEPGGLPLMQQTLQELFEQRDGNLLTLTTYEEIGGIKQAIAHRADGILNTLSPDQKQVVRHIFLRLIQSSEDIPYTRRQATIEELINQPNQLREIEELIKILADVNLITTDHSQEKGTVILNISHEALIEGWPTLQNWLNEDQVGLNIRQRLGEAAREWRDLNYEKDSLYRGTRLKKAETWANEHPDELNLFEQKFLKASIAERNKNRRQRRIIIATILMIPFLGLLAVYVFDIGSETPQPPIALSECVPPPEGLISWWPGDGHIQDIFGSNDGTEVERVGFSPGMVDQAFDFSVEGSYFMVGNPPNLKVFPDGITIEAWVRPKEIPSPDTPKGQFPRDPGLHSLVTKWGQSTELDAYALHLSNPDGSIWLTGGIGSEVIENGDPGLRAGPIPLDEWSHVAMTYDLDTDKRRLYINGRIVSDRDRGGGITQSDANVFIGREDSFLPRPFNGLIDEVSIYNRALSNAEIEAIFNAGEAGKCK